MRTPVRLLLVEDSEDDAHLLVRELKRAGYDVTHEEGFAVLEAADSEAGPRLYREHGGAVVLLDIFMPERDGLEFIREVRADRRTARLSRCQAAVSVVKWTC